ncbi:MAG: MYXO-CTERM sorting domain-containing protein, partial [Myxococcota bacterium]|nr:MYXO-CTERM sorting domain-containing protein [Myxococcota bacterium]
DAYAPEIIDWPIAERFVDVGYVPVYNEFTVHGSMAPTVLAFGYLAELDVASGADPDGDTPADGDSRGCGCSGAGGGSPAGVLGGLLALVLSGRRRSRVAGGGRAAVEEVRT